MRDNIGGSTVLKGDEKREVRKAWVAEKSSRGGAAWKQREKGGGTGEGDGEEEGEGGEGRKSEEREERKRER